MSGRKSLDLQSKVSELLAAWRALDDQGHDVIEGWATIPITTGGPCLLRAGRYFPSNQEALLVGFRNISFSRKDHLPQGHGFLVSRAELESDFTWFALSRQSSGSSELFSMMVKDIIDIVLSVSPSSEQFIYQAFIARINAWQDFMKRGVDGVLSSREELGLFGELEALMALIDIGISKDIVIDSWLGPLDNVHDLSFGVRGAIEIKSTLSSNAFTASISSLEQLNDSLISPLFLIGIQCSLSERGRTLVEQVDKLRVIFSDSPEMLKNFNLRLLHAGFFEVASSCYTRKFLNIELKIYQVSNDFPRITNENVPPAIKKVKYEIDLNMVSNGEVILTDALRKIGVI